MRTVAHCCLVLELRGTTSSSSRKFLHHCPQIRPCPTICLSSTARSIDALRIAEAIFRYRVYIIFHSWFLLDWVCIDTILIPHCHIDWYQNCIDRYWIDIPLFLCHIDTALILYWCCMYWYRINVVLESHWLILYWLVSNWYRIACIDILCIKIV